MFIKRFIAILVLLGVSFTANANDISGKLYFCEDYVDGEEIGVSDRFTTGWLTVMVKTVKPIGESKVELKLIQIKDANGNLTPEIEIDLIPFDIRPDWDYIYFQDKDNLFFSIPGTYKVVLQKKDGTELLSNSVQVVSGN